MSNEALTNLPMAPSRVLDAARAYLRRGWRVIPVFPRSKKPSVNDWPDLRASEAELSTYFGTGSTNIGLLLGEPSGGLVDVDLDALKAIAIADGFLPGTRMIHGRVCKPRSHRWYIVDDPPRSERFCDLDGKCLVEIRSTGAQTIVPPSIHPSGEELSWEGPCEPSQADSSTLRRQVAIVAAGALIARHWPKEGSRHEAALALSGGLLRGGFSIEETERFIGATVRAADDEELKKRLEAVRDTAKKLEGGAPATGWSSLDKILGHPVVNRIREFLRIPPTIEGTEPSSPTSQRWPDPPADEAFYGLAGKIVRTIEPHTESDPVAILLQMLVAFGNVIGRRPHFRVEGDLHYTNLFGVLVGKTAKARKGTSWGQTRRLYSAVDQEWSSERVQSGLGSGEGLIWAVRDPIEKSEPIRERRSITGYRTVIVDHGVADKRLLILAPEFASTLAVQGREGSILSTTLREAWDIGNLRIMNKNSPAKATGAHISVIGHITGEELRRCLNETEKANGFANRFLWFCVRRSKQLPDGGDLHTVDFQEPLSKLLAAANFARTVGEMRRDQGAREVWHRVYGELSEGRPGLLGAILGRAEAQVMRLACVYALMEQAKNVEREHLLAALALWEYCEASCRFIFGDSLGDPVADEIHQALLRRLGGMTRTEIRDHFGRNRGAHEISRALLVLEEHGLAVRIPEPTEGRTAERWIATRYTGTHRGTTETT